MELNECRMANGLELLDVNHIKERKCLKCGKVFVSMHLANRLCDDCVDENAEFSQSAEGFPEYTVEDAADYISYQSPQLSIQVNHTRKNETGS